MSAATGVHGGSEEQWFVEGDESLGDKRQVNLILRLVLDRSGELQQGEVVATTGRASGRFGTWEAMTPMVRRTVQQVSDETP